MEYFINLQLYIYIYIHHLPISCTPQVHAKMASTLLKLTTTLLLLSLHSHLSFSSNDNEEFVVDSPLANLRSRSRFLATVVKEGARCNSITRNVCNGVWQTRGQAFSIAAWSVAETCLGIRTTAGDVGISASKGSVVAVEPASALPTMFIIVASATRSVLMALDASMDIVGMLEILFKDFVERRSFGISLYNKDNL